MAKLDLDPDYIERLAELLQKSGLTEIEICHGETKIRVAKQISANFEMQSPPHTPVPQPVPTNAGTSVDGSSASGAHTSSEAAHPGAITSPMVGTVYTAADPDSPPFVTVGSMVDEGQTLLIIEAMKVMNMIRAPRSGRITHLLVKNAQPVEYGEPLIVIE